MIRKKANTNTNTPPINTVRKDETTDQDGSKTKICHS
jgi:hypothetical protein